MHNATCIKLRKTVVLLFCFVCRNENILFEKLFQRAVYKKEISPIAKNGRDLLRKFWPKLSIRKIKC